MRVNDGASDGMKVEGIVIKRISNTGVIVGNTLIILVLIAAAIVVGGKINRKEYTSQQIALTAGLFLIVLFSSMGLGLEGFITPDNNSDLPFHLGRIQGIYDNILNGSLPARLYGFYLNGYGYPNGIYYGDTLLYIPALLHVIGYSMTASYKVYILLIHVMTAYIAYWSFKEVAQRYEIGLIGSALYTLAPYRLSCVYYRSGVGEYTAMTFFPLIICGLWLLYMGDKERQKKGVAALVIGSSGIIQSHILSVILIGLAGLAFMAWFYKKTFSRQIMMLLGKTLAGIMIFNLWFIVPMADCMLTQNINIKNAGINKIQRTGKGIAELGVFDVSYPLSSIGVIMLLIPVVFCLLLLADHYFDCKYRYHTESIGVCAMGLWMLFLSSCYFPYDVLCKNSSLVNMTVGKIQFPWRWIGITGLFFCILLCLIMDNIYQIQKKFYFAALAGMAVLICGQAVLIQNMLVNRYGERYYYGGDSIDYEGYGHSLYYQVVGGEYLLEGTDLDEVSRNNHILDETGVVTDYSRGGNGFTVQVNNNSGADTGIELPLLNYKGYTVKDKEQNMALSITTGTNNRLKVLVPAGYIGTIQAVYTGMWYWRIADCISLMGVLALAGYLIYRRRCGRLCISGGDMLK